MKTLAKPCTGRGRANSGQSERQGRQNLVLQSKAEEDYKDQEIIIHLQSVHFKSNDYNLYIYRLFSLPFTCSVPYTIVYLTLYAHCILCMSFYHSRQNKIKTSIYSFCTLNCFISTYHMHASLN